MLKQQSSELKLALAKNSTYSSKPPSTDGPGAQARGVRKKKKKTPTGKKRGGQKGRRGAHRALLPLDQVHEVLQLSSERCKHCGSELKKVHIIVYLGEELIQCTKLLFDYRNARKGRRIGEQDYQL